MSTMTNHEIAETEKAERIMAQSHPASAGTRAKAPNGDSAKKHTIMFVDDELSVLKSLKRSFIDEEYLVLTAENAQEAFDLLTRHRVSLIISDHRMPGITGTEFLAKVRDRNPMTIRILLTGAADAKTVMEAIDSGILYKYITKPWDDDELRLTVKLALAQYDLIQENSRLRSKAGQQEQEIGSLRRFLNTDNSPLGTVLVDRGVILPAQLEMVQKYCSQNNIVLFRALVELGMVDEPVLLETIQEVSRADIVSLDSTKLAASLSQLVAREICESGCLVPVHHDGHTLILAMADVLDLSRVDYIRFATGLNTEVQLSSWLDIRKAISILYDGIAVEEESEEETRESSGREDIDVIVNVDESETDEQLIARSKSHSAVNLVNAIFSQAIRKRASDIHIEPKNEYTSVRYRVDGLLSEGMKTPGRLHLSLISRLKILAKMDISIRRIPQDGRIGIKTGDRQIDVRVSTMPTISGEKAVCRMLDRNASIKKMVDIGIRGDSLKRLESIISVPQGIIISTGPTGSGKTTTLYSLLNERMSDSLNFVTIEDPVEYLLNQASQVHVHDKIGVTFASTLRCTLRQDPDVILVGEIRDLETAQAAFQAAMTGHLVFTSLHTNSSVGAITRLIHLGIQPYLVASSVQGILAQRLVRKICPGCRRLTSYDQSLVERLGLPLSTFPDKLYHGGGCEACNQTGYQGRLGLFEVFHMNEKFRQELAAHYDETRLTNMAVSMGMTTLLDDAHKKVLDGSTSLEEVLRVLGPAVKYDYACTDCGKELELQFKTCPYCGKEQLRTCRDCGSGLETAWVACPRCGERPEPEVPAAPSSQEA